jgi:hypothetical protein
MQQDEVSAVVKTAMTMPTPGPPSVMFGLRALGLRGTRSRQDETIVTASRFAVGYDSTIAIGSGRDRAHVGNDSHD